MTLQLRRPAISKGSRKTKPIIVIGGIILSFIVGIGIAILGTGLPSSYSSTKNALCTSKVLELAKQGIIREVGVIAEHYTNVLTCMV